MPFCFGSSATGGGADVVAGNGIEVAIDAGGGCIVPFVGVAVSVLVSPLIAIVDTGAGSVLTYVGALVVGSGPSVEVACIPASFVSNPLYSTGGWEVERRLASVGV